MKTKFVRMARILFVAEEATLRDPVFVDLETHGHQVEAVSDASQALRALHQEPFDLVISDIQMPYMDGLELSVAIRGDHRFDDLPLIFLRAPDDDATWKQAKFLRGAHLTKPVACEELLLAVDRALQTVKRDRLRGDHLAALIATNCHGMLPPRS
jgi:CheY-like chemotaxis protein